MRSGLRGNIVQDFNFYRAGKDIVIFPAILAIKGKNMASEPDFWIVLL
jgi:hypothetical protein